MLGNRFTTETYERERFVEEATKYGIDFSLVFADEIDLIVSRDDRKSIRYRNDIVPLPDVLLARTGSGTGYFNLSVLRQFERLNVLTLPNSQAIEASKDKLYANQILAQAGLPIPKTLLTRFPCKAELVEKQVGFPCVLKVITGSHGAGVYLCRTPKEFEDLSELISSLDSKTSMIIQEYISHSEGRDLRVIVIGGRVVGAMQRTATDGSFKANISRGGEGAPHEVDDEMEMLAIQVAKVLDLDIAGVDLLFHPDGYKICEANSSPGFKGFEKALGINIPEKVFAYAKMRSCT
ncbi:ribosomal protein S6 glutaminyl transferase [Synechococcus phage S-RIM8]|nr:ribosomal protein S6 glutaminyl transferase [Synechococcus phage S-RIM8]AOO10698.1 ribosomal protein S6 glutaminyl transferase [Synechococcus phage S-RIM8]AOO11365.1 ribosomal protein S6 glutaminyl transferase [Synechococcus phage S-RIM8]